MPAPSRCDTSFLLSLYVNDSKSEEAFARMASQEDLILWTSFHEVEFDTALESRVRRGRTTREQADNAYEALAVHREVHGIYFEGAVPWDSVWSRAIRLAGQKASRHICRTLEIVHVSLAMALGAAEFLSFDDRQNTLARSLDLRTLAE